MKKYAVCAFVGCTLACAIANAGPRGRGKWENQPPPQPEAAAPAAAAADVPGEKPPMPEDFTKLDAAFNAIQPEINKVQDTTVKNALQKILDFMSLQRQLRPRGPGRPGGWRGGHGRRGGR